MGLPEIDETRVDDGVSHNSEFFGHHIGRLRVGVVFERWVSGTRSTPGLGECELGSDPIMKQAPSKFFAIPQESTWLA